jgi:lipid II:glycine glycyltransferase (peptidoglycan interpeptide bridge formation enzyme)
MTIRFASNQEIKNWNSLVCKNPDGGNIFQGYEFAQQKILGSWQPRFMIVEDIGESLVLLALEKSVLQLGKLWYVPKGPGVTSGEDLESLCGTLKNFAAQQHVFMVKVEPELSRSATKAYLDSISLLTSVPPIQPNFSTVLLDLSPPLDDILSGLPQKGRYAIKKAERDGASAKAVVASDKNCRVMFDLLKDTAQHSGFGIRSFEYYKSYWQRYEKAGIGQLFFAYVDKKVVAGAYALAFGKKGTYKDGASIRERTVYGASHLLQWTVITWLKSKGITVHDLCGAPPSDKIKDSSHPHYGIGLFKTSFNKEVTDYVGAYDLIVTPLRYKLWTKVGEKLVKRQYWAMHHESYY